MKLVSTTLTGNNQDQIGDAIRSLRDWVDVCLVIDTGATDRSMQIARDVAGDKFVERQFPWRSDFAAARNFALEAAAQLGGDWAITVDTDERIEPRGEDIRGELERATEGVLMMTHDSGTYGKERIFRLPAKARFTGPTHESFPSYDVGARTLAKARFIELDKSPEAFKAKFERDVAILQAHTAENPKDARWFYYLGDALQNLKRWEEAIASYEKCAALRGWNEESAWACYRAAECWIVLKRFSEAVDACAAGLARHAGIAELAWLAAFASYQGGRIEQAIYWARLAIPMGLFRGRGADAKRIGFRNLNALYEGPYDVLRFALKAVGDHGGALEAEQNYYAAIRERQNAK